MIRRIGQRELPLDLKDKFIQSSTHHPVKHFKKECIIVDEMLPPAEIDKIDKKLKKNDIGSTKPIYYISEYEGTNNGSVRVKLDNSISNSLYKIIAISKSGREVVANTESDGSIIVKTKMGKRTGKKQYSLPAIEFLFQTSNNEDAEFTSDPNGSVTIKGWKMINEVATTVEEKRLSEQDNIFDINLNSEIVFVKANS